MFIELCRYSYVLISKKDNPIYVYTNNELTEDEIVKLMVRYFNHDPDDPEYVYLFCDHEFTIDL